MGEQGCQTKRLRTGARERAPSCIRDALKQARSDEWKKMKRARPDLVDQGALARVVTEHLRSKDQPGESQRHLSRATVADVSACRVKGFSDVVMEALGEIFQGHPEINLWVWSRDAGYRIAQVKSEGGLGTPIMGETRVSAQGLTLVLVARRGEGKVLVDVTLTGEDGSRILAANAVFRLLDVTCTPGTGSQ